MCLNLGQIYIILIQLIDSTQTTLITVVGHEVNCL